MTGLADKLRAAEHGSLYLDADLYEAAGFQVRRGAEVPGGIAWRYFDAAGRRWLRMRDLTTITEDALRLVPAGRPLALLVYPDGRASAVVGAAHGSPPRADLHPVLASPALAVCHACYGVQGWQRRLVAP